MRHCAFIATLASFMLFACEGEEDAHDDARPPREVRDCPRTPCDITYMSAEENETAQRIEGVLVAEIKARELSRKESKDPAFIQGIGEVVAVIDALAGVRKVSAERRWIHYWTEPGGYRHDLRVADPVSIPAHAAEALLTREPDVRASLRVHYELTELTIRQQALIARGDRDPFEQGKQARLLSLWNWYTKAVADKREVYRTLSGELAAWRDYQEPRGGITIGINDDPWLPGATEEEDSAQQENFKRAHAHFTGWSELSLLYLTSHGHEEGFHISTGYVLGWAEEPVPEGFMEGDGGDRRGLNCADFWATRPPVGYRCDRHPGHTFEDRGKEGKTYTLYTLGFDHRHLARVGSDLADGGTILVTQACGTLKDIESDPVRKTFLGDRSVTMGGDGDMFASNDYPDDFVFDLITFNQPSNVVYSFIDPARLRQDSEAGVYRHYPSSRGARVAEAISIALPGTGVPLADGDVVPVIYDEEGRPRGFELELLYGGVLFESFSVDIGGVPYAAARDDGPAFWETRVFETSGAGGAREAELTRAPFYPFARETVSYDTPTTEGALVLLTNDRDILTDDPITLLAVTSLPEGGESYHSVTITPDPIQARWSIEARGEELAYEAREDFVEADYRESIERLTIFLREDQDALVGMDGEVKVDIVITGFQGGEGLYGGGGQATMSLEIKSLDLRCSSSSASVQIDRFEDQDHLSGSFIADGMYCGAEKAPLDLSGNFMLARP